QWLKDFSTTRRGAAREAYEAATQPRFRRVKQSVRGPAGIVALSAVLLVSLVIFALDRARPYIVHLQTPAPPPVVNPIAADKVDRFSRQFVSEMLDFNAGTYRISQI